MRRTLVLAILAGFTLAGCSTAEKIDTAAETTTTGAPASSTTAAPTSTTSTTAAPTTTAPTTTTTAPPQPSHYEGAGDDVVTITKPTSVAIVHLVHTGQRNFIVRTVNAAGAGGGGLVNEIGAYDGVRLLDVREGEETAALEITADGSWTADVMPLNMATLWSGSDSLMGTGDAVVVIPGGLTKATPTAILHTGSSNFIVRGYGDTSSSGLVNEIGAYQGTKLLPRGLNVLEITADGSWSFIPQA